MRELVDAFIDLYVSPKTNKPLASSTSLLYQKFLKKFVADHQITSVEMLKEREKELMKQYKDKNKRMMLTSFFTFWKTQCDDFFVYKPTYKELVIRSLNKPEARNLLDLDVEIINDTKTRRLIYDLFGISYKQLKVVKKEYEGYVALMMLF